MTLSAVGAVTSMNTTVSIGQQFEMGKQVAEKLGQMKADGELVQEAIKSPQHAFWAEVEKYFAPKLIAVPDLTGTGPTLFDWLTAREELHRFFTGETIIFRDQFVFTDEQLARTDLIPVFRPSGATNRLAVDWKKKLGVVVYEEVDVMRYKNSVGSKTPELFLISRSVCPDEDTLGKKAMSPDQIVAVPNKIWIGLYGWCDADSLHFAITGNHLDLETVTCFPNDRLPDGFGARGSWRGAKVYLGWRYADRCHSHCGARAAVPVSLKH